MFPLLCRIFFDWCSPFAYFINFVFVAWVFGVIVIKSLPRTLSKSFSSSCSRSFAVLGLMFKSLSWCLCRGKVDEKTMFSPPCTLGILVKGQLTINAWIYFWALYSVSSVYMPGVMPVPDYLNYWSFVIYFESMNLMPPALLFFFKMICCVWFSMVLYDLQNYFFISVIKYYWDFDRLP